MVEKFRDTKDILGEPKTPQGILGTTSYRFNSLRTQALNAYYSDEKSPEKRAITRRELREDGELIASLPDRLQGAVQTGHSFPQAAMREIEYFAEDASNYLERGSDFGLAFILLYPRTEPIRPQRKNALELLVDRLYPPKESK